MAYFPTCAANPAKAECPFGCTCQGHYKVYPNQPCTCAAPQEASEDRAAQAQTVYICGGDMSPEERGDCPDTLHDWPLPAGYVVAAEVAARRLRNGWRTVRCPQCGLYGWREGRIIGRGDTFVPHSEESK